MVLLDDWFSKIQRRMLMMMIWMVLMDNWLDPSGDLASFTSSPLRQSSTETTFMNLPLYSGVASQTFITIEVTRPCMQLATLHSIKPILVKTYEEGCFRQVSGTSPPCIPGHNNLSKPIREYSLQDQFLRFRQLEMSVCVHRVCKCGKMRPSSDTRDKLMDIVNMRHWDLSNGNGHNTTLCQLQ